MVGRANGVAYCSMNRGGMRSQHRPAPSGQLPHSSNSWPFVMVSFYSTITFTLLLCRSMHTHWLAARPEPPSQPPARPTVRRLAPAQPPPLTQLNNLTSLPDGTLPTDISPQPGPKSCRTNHHRHRHHHHHLLLKLTRRVKKHSS